MHSAENDEVRGYHWPPMVACFYVLSLITENTVWTPCRHGSGPRVPPLNQRHFLQPSNNQRQNKNRCKDIAHTFSWLTLTPLPWKRWKRNWIATRYTIIAYWIPNKNEIHPTRYIIFEKIGIWCLAHSWAYRYIPEHITKEWYPYITWIWWKWLKPFSRKQPFILWALISGAGTFIFTAHGYVKDESLS
jgi:hypothetical protein